MNIPYEAKTKDGAQVWEPVGDPILLTNTSGNVYAYYPYSEEITSLREIPIKASSTHQVDYKSVQYGTIPVIVLEIISS